MHINDRLANPKRTQTRNRDFEQRTSADLHECLGAIIRERPQARPQARGQNHRRFHELQAICSCAAPFAAQYSRAWLASSLAYLPQLAVPHHDFHSIPAAQAFRQLLRQIDRAMLAARAAKRHHQVFEAASLPLGYMGIH